MKIKDLSIPKSFKQSKLATLFYFSPRKKFKHTFTVVWDKRFPLLQKFKNNYSYVIDFSEKNDVAGNHYHKKKHEIFIPLQGRIKVYLKNVITEKKEEINLSKNSCLSIPPGIAHAAVAKTARAILLVIASSPSTEEDEFEYTLT